MCVGIPGFGKNRMRDFGSAMWWHVKGVFFQVMTRRNRVVVGIGEPGRVSGLALGMFTVLISDGRLLLDLIVLILVQTGPVKCQRLLLHSE